MPYYRFEIQSSLSPESAIGCVQAKTGGPRGYWEDLKYAFGLSRISYPPFVGKVEGYSFRLYRDSRFRHGSIALMWGEIRPAFRGSIISVVMFINPGVAFFILIMLLTAGFFAFLTISSHDNSGWFIQIVIFTIIALQVIWFYREAIKAQRLLEAALKEKSIKFV